MKNVLDFDEMWMSWSKVEVSAFLECFICCWPIRIWNRNYSDEFHNFIQENPRLQYGSLTSAFRRVFWNATVATWLSDLPGGLTDHSHLLHWSMNTWDKVSYKSFTNRIKKSVRSNELAIQLQQRFYVSSERQWSQGKRSRNWAFFLFGWDVKPRSRVLIELIV